MKSTPKLVVSPMLNKQRQKEGKSKLFIRVTLDGKRFEVSSNFYVESKFWDSKTMLVKSSDSHASIVNSFINKAKMDLDKIFMRLVALGETISIEKIKSIYLGIEIKNEKPKSKTILDAITYHNNKMEEMVEIDKISNSTLARYKMTKNKVISFMKSQYNCNDKELNELKLSFITEFEHYLLTNGKLNTNTAHKHIKNIKKIINVAIGLDWIQINPFTQFRCSYKNPEREILNQTEIDSIINKDLKYERLEKVRDVFIFCCYTGFAYSDVKAFNRNAVTLGIDGEYWLSTFRQKTGIKESVPLLPIAKEIIEKYKDNPYCVKHNKMLPVNCNQKFNDYLKEIAIHCKINKKLTSHIARHTFATTITLANGVPIETVSSMLGHTSIRTTQIYAKVVEQKVSDDMKKLREKLATPIALMKIS
jgi:site-specific recombinase XerD